MLVLAVLVILAILGGVGLGSHLADKEGIKIFFLGQGYLQRTDNGQAVLNIVMIIITTVIFMLLPASYMMMMM